MAQIIFLYLMVLSGNFVIPTFCSVFILKKLIIYKYPQYIFFLKGLLPFDPASITGLIAGSIVNAVVEGNTDQIDNIVLPLVTFIVIHACGILLKV